MATALPYDLATPRLALALPGPYREISGLCYVAAEHRLLISCRGSTCKASQERAIFSFSLETSCRSDTPLFCVDASLFLEQEKEFNPSGIAVHPVCHDLFLVGTKGAKRIVRYGVDGSFKGAWKLDAGLFPQPEGITFLGSGDLLIASEGKKSRRPGRGGRGSVMVFPMLGSPGSPTAPPSGQGCDRAQPR